MGTNKKYYIKAIHKDSHHYDSRAELIGKEVVVDHTFRTVGNGEVEADICGWSFGNVKVVGKVGLYYINGVKLTTRKPGV